MALTLKISICPKCRRRDRVGDYNSDEPCILMFIQELCPDCQRRHDDHADPKSPPVGL